MKSKLNIILLLFCFQILSCNKNLSITEIEDCNGSAVETNQLTDDFLMIESLPEWVIETGIINDKIIEDKFEIESRLNPFYLEEDFNGDGILDFAIGVKEIKTDKIGFVIIHGGTPKVYVIGAGNLIKNGLSDDMSYIDIWKINREKENFGTELDENGDITESAPVFIDHPSIKIIKSEVGGGIIFWNGGEYEYLHQTC